MKTQAKLLSFGAGGHAIHAHNETHSGYCDPDDFCKLYQWWAHEPGKLSSHWSDYDVPPEGIPAIDKRAAVETKEGRAWVFAGPMVNVDLEKGEVDACPEPSPYMAGAMTSEPNAFGTLLTIQATQRMLKQRGALDGVSIAEYVEGWREHGARIGRAYRNADGSGRIEWETP